MKLVEINLEDYKPHPQNYNLHDETQVTELGKSLGRFGQFKNVVVWNGFYLAGHGLVEAAQKEKLKTLQAVDVSHLGEEDAKALMVADNTLPELSDIDDEMLLDLLKEFDDPLEIPGIDDDFLAQVGGFESVNESMVQTGFIAPNPIGPDRGGSPPAPAPNSAYPPEAEKVDTELFNAASLPDIPTRGTQPAISYMIYVSYPDEDSFRDGLALMKGVEPDKVTLTPMQRYASIDGTELKGLWEQQKDG